MKNLIFFISLTLTANVIYARPTPHTKLRNLKRGYILTGDLDRNQVRFNTNIKVHEYGAIQENSFAPNCKIDTSHGLEIFSTMINKSHSYSLNSINYNDYTKVMRIRASNVFNLPRDLIFTCENVLSLESSVKEFERAFGEIITIQ